MVELYENSSDKTSELGFDFSARFSQLIGRHLISNPIVAVLELAKNSYDADATDINVVFIGLFTNNPKIIISDNGSGMTIEDIKNKWMIIGTDNKMDDPITESGRRKLGEKGIGRFSVERLSKRTTIRTTTAGTKELIEMFIDWEIYEGESKYFTQVKHPVKYEDVGVNDKGTTIILEGLRDVWNEDAILQLKKELFLIKPLSIGNLSPQFKEGVEINLQCEDYPSKSGKIDLNLLKYYHAKLFGQILETGDVKLELELKVNKKNSNKETGVLYTRFIPKQDVNYSCGPVVFEAYAFLRSGRINKGLEIERSKFTDMLDEYGGIKIYRDDFRVKPYGDKENDWLLLNLQRTKDPEYRLSTNQVIGGVKIERDNNPGLQDVLSRESLYETGEFKSLRAFVNSVFEFYHYASFVEYRDDKKKDSDTRKELYSKLLKSNDDLKKAVVEKKEKLQQQKKEVQKIYNEDARSNETVNEHERVESNEESKVKETANAIDKVNAILEDIEKDYEDISNMADKIVDDANETSVQLKKKEKFQNRELQIYRNIASLGISAAQFGHETEKLIINSILAFDEIKSSIQNVCSDDELVAKELDLLERYLNTINEKVDFFRGYLKKEKQDQEEIINIVNLFRNVADDFDNTFDKISAKIEIIESAESEKSVYGYYGDFESIITNIITNAYKALVQGTNLDKYLKITFNQSKKSIFINTINNGKPIEADDRKHIFQPLFTTNKDGTGLGLTIIQDTLKEYGGCINLLEDYPETHFRIEIPIQREGENHGEN